jgi:CHAD domain-containing protein
MSGPVYSTSEVLTGMCLWEAWADLTVSMGDGFSEETAIAHHAVKIQETMGSWHCRDLTASCIRDVEEAWHLADTLNEGDNGEFDWEFVPAWLNGAIASGRFD